MPTLSASNTVFQLAFGVNAVLPVLITDFERVRERAADSLFRKIKEYRPEFSLKQQDRNDFVDFTFKSSCGLRHARVVTYITVFMSSVLCGISLAALCWSAFKPAQQISAGLFLWFTGVTLIGAPLFYVLRDRYLKWLYSLLVTYSSNARSEALLFAECVDIYLKHKKEWEPIHQKMNEAMADIALMGWKLRWARVQVRLIVARGWIRSMFRFHAASRPP